MFQCSHVPMILSYQDDFLIPGIAPLVANSLKQIRQRPNSLIYPRFLPQRQHRLTMRVLYLGAFFDLTTCDILAIKKY